MSCCAVSATPPPFPLVSCPHGSHVALSHGGNLSCGCQWQVLPLCMLSCCVTLSHVVHHQLVFYSACLPHQPFSRHTYICTIDHVFAASSAVIAPSILSRDGLVDVRQDVIHRSLFLFVSVSVCCRAGCPISQSQGGGSLDHPDHAQRSPRSSPWDPLPVWRHVRRGSHPEPAGSPGTQFSVMLNCICCIFGCCC